MFEEISFSRLQSNQSTTSVDSSGPPGIDDLQMALQDGSLGDLSKRLRAAADALMQAANSMGPAACESPPKQRGVRNTEPPMSIPSLGNAVGEAAAQAQRLAWHMQKTQAPPGQPEAVDRPAAPRHEKDSMRAHLMELNNEDPECVFIVRRIHKFGMASRMVLQQHFSQYGEVTQVYVAESKVKCISLPPITRPGNLGFVVMKSADSVKDILAVGAEQAVGRHQIRVQKFQAKAENWILSAASRS
jgi:hypothetical protein